MHKSIRGVIGFLAFCVILMLTLLEPHSHMWGQTSLIISSLSPKRDWGPKRVNASYVRTMVLKKKRNYFCNYCGVYQCVLYVFYNIFFGRYDSFSQIMLRRPPANDAPPLRGGRTADEQ